MSRTSFVSRRTRWLTMLGVAAASLSLPPHGALAAATTAKPSASTGGVANVRGASATLNGGVNPNGLPTEYFFQFGPTVAYGSETEAGALAAGLVTVKVGRLENGMQPGWHYRIVAKNELGETVGKDRVYALRTSKLKVTLDKPSGQHVIGGGATLTGGLTGAGAANHKVVLQAVPYPYTGPFANVAGPLAASASGRFSFTLSHLSSSSEYRVATTDPRPTYSRPQTLLVALRVTLHVQTTSRRGVVRLYGSVSPAETGAKVFFELQKPLKDKVFKSEKAEERAEERGGHWASQFVATVKHATASLSRFSSKVLVKRAGRYRAYVQIKKGPLVSGYSATVTLRAAPGKKKRKHHKRKRKG
jgi:hypothetical protein